MACVNIPQTTVGNSVAVHTALNTHPNHNVILEGIRFDVEAPFQRRLRSQSDIHPIPISEEVATGGLNRATRGLSSLRLIVHVSQEPPLLTFDEIFLESSLINRNLNGGM